MIKGILYWTPTLPNTVADNVRRAWIRNNMNGRGDASFVIRRDGDVAGFNLCLFRGDTAVIDLIAVSPAYQKMGIGSQLVTGALEHYRGRATRVRVGTQVDNLASITLYEKTGFAVAQQQTTLHWVNPDVSPDSHG
jgi:ribosomal protein S18 acetylase RimI-like enzyme